MKYRRTIQTDKLRCMSKLYLLVGILVVVSLVAESMRTYATEETTEQAAESEDSVQTNVQEAESEDSVQTNVREAELDAGTQDTEEKVVRVAYVISENFQEGEEGERKYGYGYEYLQEISYYTGWKYEYVYGDFQESLNRLMNGEVDLMANLSYTDERAERIYYSEEPQGEEIFRVFGCVGQTELDSKDMSSFNGKKIGVNKGSHSVELAQEWIAENNIDCELIEYADMEQLKDDLNNHVIQAVVASEIYMDENWMPLDYIDSAPYYYGVARNRTDLLEELNEAMDAIQIVNPFYNEELRVRYFASPSSATITLFESERERLAGQQIRVGYLNDCMPYCELDSETGEADGMMADLLSSIGEQYSFEYETIAYDSYDEMQQALQDGTVDAIFPLYGDYGIAEAQNIMISDATTTTSMMVFNRNNNRMDSKSAKVAVSRVGSFQKTYISIFYPDAEQIEYDNNTDCIQAVIDGDVDFTVVESAIANLIQIPDYGSNIQKADLRDVINVSFGVRRGDIELLSILNKGMMKIEDSEIVNSMIYHSRSHSQYTVMDFLREHIVAVLLLMICVFGIIITTLTRHYISIAKSKQQVTDAYHQIRTAKWEAAHDALTGLLNRSAFQKVCLTLKEMEQPMAVLVIDVDKFKLVNDTYGHKIGDVALVKVSKILNQSFREEDYVIRYAGDEFVVLMMNMTPKEVDVISSKINNINQQLQKTEDNVPKLSVSVGIAFSADGYSDELFNQADEALYHTKENGRCGYTVYQKKEG